MQNRPSDVQALCRPAPSAQPIAALQRLNRFQPPPCGLGLLRQAPHRLPNLGEYLAFVDTRGFMLGPRLVLDGFWEAGVTLALARYIQPGVHGIDVRANHGYYSVQMALACGRGDHRGQRAGALDSLAPAVSFVAEFLLRSYPMHVGFDRLTEVSAELPEVSDMTKLNEYVKIAEAARILGVSQNTLRAWAEAGKIPVRRNPANRYRLFLRRDLERFLAKVAGRTKD
jgi:excisionase family DNA binding protein